MHDNFRLALEPLEFTAAEHRQVVQVHRLEGSNLWDSTLGSNRAHCNHCHRTCQGPVDFNIREIPIIDFDQVQAQELWSRLTPTLKKSASSQRTFHNVEELNGALSLLLGWLRRASLHGTRCGTRSSSRHGGRRGL